MTPHSPLFRSRHWGRASALALLALTAAAPAFAQGAPAAAEAPSKIPVLTRAQIDTYLAQPDKVLFIDVRRPDEVASIGGFPAYLSIQISDLERYSAFIPKDRQLVVLSNHAGRGQKGAELLAAKGFTVIGAAGAESYEKEGGSVWLKKIATPDIAGVVKAGTPVLAVANGFAGSEGPAVLADGSVLFTEQRTDRIIKIDPKGGVSTYLENDGGAHRLALNAKGEVVAAETGAGHVGITVLGDKPRVIAAAYKGQPFLHPNDLAISKRGDIYVTDPGAYQQAVRGGAKPAGPVKTGVYRITPKGKVSLVTDAISWPNGIVLSPDEKTIYIANTVSDTLLAFTVNPDGSLSGQRDFAKLAGFKTGANGVGRGADGIAIDKDGRVYATTSAGVEVFDATGKSLGVIPVPRQPQAVVFGGPDRSRLFVTARGSIYRIATLTRGPERDGR